LNCTSALDRADGESGRVREAAHNPRLPLQRTRDRLVNLARLVQIYNVDVALGRRNDEQRVLDIHAVHALLALQLADGRLAREVPVLDRLVPGARGQEVLAAVLEPADAFYAGRVRFPAVRDLNCAAFARGS